MANTRENEAEAVRTTIVGGRPPGSGRSNVPVPRGIEVMVKKAAVDAEFRELLLSQRGKAAASIELELDPAESAMLSAIPREQLARIVDQTEVATELRPAFAGRVGAVMLAALGAGLVTSGVAKPASVLSDQPQGAASAPEVSTSANATLLAQGYVVFGNRGYWPTNPPPANPPPTNPPALIKGLRADLIPVPTDVAGVRPTPLTNPPPTNPPPPVRVFGARITPPTNPPPTNPPPNPPPGAIIRGIQPSRPPLIVAGAMVPVPPPTNPPATNPPATNAAPSEPNRPVRIFGLMTLVPPPKAPEMNPQTKGPDQQK
jgi:hypothetical protein